MANLFDYIAWRGDLPMEKIGFQEVDGMILARLAYARFEDAAPLLRGGTPLGEAARVLAEKQEDLTADDAALLRALAQSRRFSALRLLSCENHFDAASQTQFSAITVGLPENACYIAFRGTDSTLVGWKENFNMTFLSPVPAQREAVRYLTAAAQNASRLILGGHSKGGNLAIYAAAFCELPVQERIDAIYNYDGPGFAPCVLGTEGYRRVLPRVHSFVPQSSIIGMLLEHEENISVVHSDRANGLRQHDLYSWEILPSGFSCLAEVTSRSRFIDATVSTWLAALEDTQRKRVIDTIYQALEQADVHTLQELSANWFTAAKLVIKTVRSCDEETKNAVLHTIRLLMQSMQKALPKTFRRS